MVLPVTGTTRPSTLYQVDATDPDANRRATLHVPVAMAMPQPHQEAAARGRMQGGRDWWTMRMSEAPRQSGMVGPFWVVEDRGKPALIAHAVPLAQAVPYGEMLTVEMGHLEFWSELAHRGARSLSAAGLPTAPVWSEYEEWPRGRVLYDCMASVFVIRADPQLLGVAFRRLIADCFRISTTQTKTLPDDHYRSMRRVPVPAGDGTGTA